MNKTSTCALVLGGYVNGYSIIKELHEKKVQEIILFDNHKSLGSYSNKVSEFHLVNKSATELREAIFNLHKKKSYIIIFPTDDVYIELLNELYTELSKFCFIPFNNSNVINCLDKYYQYNVCENLGIPYPKTTIFQSKESLSELSSMTFPILIKPNKRYDFKEGVFRSLLLNSIEDYLAKSDLIRELLDRGIELIASELIPGDDTNIYAYVAYRSYNGKILNDWIGKKLTQYPNEFGVFSSATNEAPEIIRKQGEILLEAMNIYGIAEPEFKYDIRDDKYKLTEINLRSMMWHRLGNISGVHLQYTQYQDALGITVKKEYQQLNNPIHFVYMKHELLNLIFRKGYFKHFYHNVFGGKERAFAIYEFQDIKPFLIDCLGLLKGFISRCLKIF